MYSVLSEHWLLGSLIHRCRIEKREEGISPRQVRALEDAAVFVCGGEMKGRRGAGRHFLREKIEKKKTSNFLKKAVDIWRQE